MGAAAVRMGVVGWCASCCASVFLFRDIKISFGAFVSTDSYVALFSTPENTRHDAGAKRTSSGL